MRALLALAILAVACKEPEIPPVWRIPPGEIDSELWREVCGGDPEDSEDDWSPSILGVIRRFQGSSSRHRRSCEIHCDRNPERGEEVAVCDQIRLYADTRDDMERLAARIAAPMVPPAVRRRMPEIIDRPRSASVPVGPFVLGGGYTDDEYSLRVSCPRCEPSPLPPLPAPSGRR